MSASDIVKAIIPGSVEFLLLGVVIGALLVGARGRMHLWGQRWLIALFVGYVVLSLHGTSALLMRGLNRGAPLTSAADARGARTIVVLGNGSFRHQVGTLGLDVMNAQTAYNTLEGARLAALLPEARLIASGGPSSNGLGSEAAAIANALIELGVPSSRIDLEIESRTTKMQGTRVERILRARGERTFVLVTTPEHMWRARGVFLRLGLDPIPSASAIDYGNPPFWRPSRNALQGSENAIYEYIAGLSYWLRAARQPPVPTLQKQKGP